MAVEKGDRIRVTGLMPEDPDPIPVGTEGTVLSVNDYGQIFVKWDIDRSLIILTTDPFAIIKKGNPV